MRKAFLEFFQEKDHRLMPSDSLVPQDPSLLFTSAGMVQFKPYFLGTAQPPHPRAATAQKCFRTTDIESVGDASHCTFFEMLGNFSFGDYFKREAVHWAWEFLTERLKLDPNRLQFTVFKDDDEAFDLWNNGIGIPEERIWRLDEDANYWPANVISEGPNGPCGPCSEIFYDTAPGQECGNPQCGPACECGRWLEIWNLVFIQYERTEKNGEPVLTPLPKQNIDTGMGVERTACVLSGFPSVFETDVFMPIIRLAEQLSGHRYGQSEASDSAFRLIADHTRAAVFCIADGVLPQNEGRGYVLRRIIRRAALRGQRALGLKRPFLADLLPGVIEALGDQYPELQQRKELISATLQTEEERFLHTVAAGLARLEEALAGIEEGGQLSGETAFMLYDTYGFPLELTREVAAERDATVDEHGFESSMEAQRQRAREAGGMSDQLFVEAGTALAELAKAHGETRFVGYTDTESEATIVGIVLNGNLIDSAQQGQTVEIVLDQTPFYAESGGQVGDTGQISANDLIVRVLDTKKRDSFTLHHAQIVTGTASRGQTVRAAIDLERRRRIMRHHTTTHLLHAALRNVLGKHVSQAGSLVAPDRLRFDFTHGAPMTKDEIATVERMVNEQILAESPVIIHEHVPLAEARERGAMALFGEKYGDSVRMVEIPGFSLELCGGTHLGNAIQAGLFKIVHEGSVASGVRRIEALTGDALLDWLSEREATLEEASHLASTTVTELPKAIERLKDRIKEEQREVQRLRASQMAGKNNEATTIAVAGLQVAQIELDGADPKSLGAAVDALADQGASVAIGVSNADGKALWVVKCKPDAIAKGLKAGDIVKKLAEMTGGGGGGRPDFAQAGGRDPSKIESAVKMIGTVLSELAGE